ncbi:transaldolase [Nocardioides limicola]|uniref:transaldolase n=1 Tax=Nocardioides limicola TaxID=2803368 RepID=UPI00193C81CF|nr:transaldolase [Nocardioides sp. DJM-14]
MSDRLSQLSRAGVSIWLDDLSRERIETGNLAALIADSSVVGVTTNPSIFAAALASGARYDEQVRALAAAGTDVEEAVFELTTTDVRNACDQLRSVFDATGGVDGRVSIEVSPELAHDGDGTLSQAKELWAAVDRENLFIKIPATEAGLPAITATLAAGISVNVTLIFGLDRYRQVLEAHARGIEQALAAGHDVSGIQSVASFFVSRVDTEIDNRLDKIGGDTAGELKGLAGVANARLAHQLFADFVDSERWRSLADAGAAAQRPLWASTGVKNPAYSDTMYVTDLAVSGTVNTMPQATLDAFADHGEVLGDQVTGYYEHAAQVMADLAAVGVDYDDVIAVLEAEGVDKFIASWRDLLATVSDQLAGADA